MLVLNADTRDSSVTDNVSDEPNVHNQALRNETGMKTEMYRKRGNILYRGIRAMTFIGRWTIPYRYDKHPEIVLNQLRIGHD